MFLPSYLTLVEQQQQQQTLLGTHQQNNRVQCLMFPRKHKYLIEAGEGDKREKNINAIRNKKQTNKQKYSIM